MLDKDSFLRAVDAVPLVAVDLVAVRGGAQILLGLRNNQPAQSYWFAPGGRIRKNESIQAALGRVARNELALDINRLPQPPGLLGGFEHFYDDCFAGDVGVSTHYVVLAHTVQLPPDWALPVPDAQHAELRWWPLEQALHADTVHRFTKEYVQRLLLSKT